MTNFFNKFKKLCFEPIFSSFFQFSSKKIFPENPPLPHTTSYGFLAASQNLEKANDAIPRKRPDRRTDGRMDRRTDRPYFIAPFRLKPGHRKKILLSIKLFLLKQSSSQQN